MTAVPTRSPARARLRPRGVVLLLAVAVVAVTSVVAAVAWAATAIERGGAPAAVLPVLSDRAQSGDLESAAALTDTHLPAIANLDPALYDAMVQAGIAAASDGIVFEVTSGWRSRDYQQRLFDEAVVTYGSVEVAAQWVASPDTSAHVFGRAIDIGPVDAQFWLIEHGAQWGLCQIYANERWHFELATTPGGQCPDLRPDAAG
jgi:zinc D-Ala-D-Ala carboxypeptidase